MIALGTTIGTGIFLNSGRSIAEGGPAGALIAYCVSKLWQPTCLVNISVNNSVSGSIFQFSTRFLDKSLGFSLGINYTYVTLIELSSAARIIRFWGTVMPDAAWASIFWVIVFSSNLFSVKLYGEIEYWVCLFKVLMIIVFIIVAILLTSGAIGGPTIGFEYWKTKGAFANGGLGTIDVLLSAGFSFLGTENVALVAGETQNPTKAIPRAIRTVFWRIIIFYVVTMLLLGMCLPFDDPRLNFTNSDAGTGSFTLVFEKAGISAGANVINAAVLISILSACNAIVYATSRIILGMARDGNLPQFFTRVNRFGAPYYAVFGSTFVAFICIFISIYRASTVLVWCLNLSSISGFINWSSIGWVQIRFRRGYMLQGRDLNDLPYKASLYPYGPIFAVVLPILIILAQGYGSFYPKWDAVTFVSSYIGIVPFVLSYLLHKMITKSKIVPLEEIDYETGTMTKFDIEFDEQNDTIWRKWTSYLA
ncbi:hypothetical protein K501DRAFT_230301 [Backusella circina FSU 941]|nr:hypothetical protein K501DRAFT_230301 [Backusella circina FSU 941]